MANIRDVSNLDFNDIKENLKQYLKNQDQFNDYDFEGSGMAVILDLLSYNTHMNAVLAHMTMNESFLNSAKKRNNVSAHAALLGYTPRSRQAARVEGTLVLFPVDQQAVDPSVTLPKGASFTSNIRGNVVTFITNTSYTANATLVDGSYRYTMPSVTLYQGSQKSISYRVDNSIKYQKFEIPHDNVDTSTISVKVYDSPNTNEFTSFVKYNDISTVTSNSKVYFMHESAIEKYEIYFGDGSVGFLPTTNSVVEITYIVTDGEEGDGATSFILNDAPGTTSNASFTMNAPFTRSTGGAEREGVEAIRFNSPLYFSTQNRGVTAEDYRSLVYNNFSYVRDISTWGGEQNEPPIYGKVFMSIKPEGRDYTTLQEKDDITSFLQNKNVGSITVEILDPDYTYLALEVLFKFNPSLTSKTIGEITSDIKNAVTLYGDDNLSLFNGVFRSSNLVSAVDDVDPSVLNSIIRLNMFKKFTPTTNVATTYTLKFSSPIYDQDEFVVESSSFFVNNVECFFRDIPSVDGTYDRNISLYRKSDGSVVTGYNNIGYVDLAKGIVVINDLLITSTLDIRVTAEPASNDVAPRFNQLIAISNEDVVVAGEVDTIATLGSAGAAGYKTFNRHG